MLNLKLDLMVDSYNCIFVDVYCFVWYCLASMLQTVEISIHFFQEAEQRDEAGQ